MSKRYAAVAITRSGIRLALKLGARLDETEVFVYAKYSGGLEGRSGEITVFDGPVQALLLKLFGDYEGIILFFSLGAAVRLTAPLLRDKRTDPAVIVIDERGEHVISMLSGHLGGANRLTLQIAELLGSHPVITTASDVQGTFAVDLLGREYGWRADSFIPMKAVSAALVNGEAVALVQESGERSWLPPGAELPGHVRLFASRAELQESGLSFSAAIFVSDRLAEGPGEVPGENQGEKQDIAVPAECTVVYRPRSLVLGLGCNRGTSAEELEAVVRHTLNKLRLSFNSVRNVATAGIKGDEAGLLALCAKYSWDLVLYTPEQLNTVELDSPSEVVFRATGAYGVCEPAALLSSGAPTLLQPKLKSGNVTIAVARVVYSEEMEGSV
ncbi:cobalamin biosynthesis protein [Paenibacillus tritici]|uniref:cobalt-precorrin 5A hydrolase n=1 Tax=Paenibacillus tritici TaxID=1873425 RepID=UPI001BAD3C0A|nr:cobalamin biosynthesis protein [Paenibacillus tritici]QUL56591.1 cobalamin biosynthesis protein [Paenibacillus tritici]